MIFILFALKGLEIMDVQTGAWSLILGDFHPGKGGFSVISNPWANQGKIPEFSLYYSRWFEGIHNGGVIARFNFIGFRSGMFLKGIYSGDIEKYPEGGSYGVGFYDVGFNLCREIKGVYTGINFSTWMLSLEEKKGYGFHLDIGTSKNIGKNLLFLSFKNIGAGLALESVKTPYPFKIAGGFFYKKGIVSSSFVLVYSTCAGFYINPGILFTPFKPFSFGINISTETKEILERFGVGAGFELRSGPLSLVYAVKPFSVGLVHSLELSMRMQAVSEEEIARKVEEEFRKRTEEASNAYLERGIALFEEKKFDEAIDAWDMALIWNPHNKKALEWIKKAEKEKKKAEISKHIEQAKKSFLSGDYMSAQREAAQALALDSLNNLAKFYYNEATKKINQDIVKVSTEEERRYLEKGVEFFGKGDFENAILNFEEVLKINPSNPVAAEYISKIGEETKKYVKKEIVKVDYLISKKRYREAKNKLKRLLKIAPEDPELLKKLGEIESRMDRELNRLLEKGKEYYKNKDYDTARRYFESVLVISPGHSMASSYLEKIKKKERGVDPQKYYIMGVQAYADGDYELAIAYWEKVLSVDPENENARKNIERAKSRLAYIKKY